jgi:hypothetical protein
LCDVVALSGLEERVSAFLALLASIEVEFAGPGVFAAGWLSKRACSFGEDLDRLLLAFSRVGGVSSLDGLPQTALDYLPLHIEPHLLEFAHKIFLIEALSRDGH